MTASDVVAAGKRAGAALVKAATRPDGTVDHLHLAAMLAVVMRGIDASSRWARRIMGGRVPNEETRG